MDLDRLKTSERQKDRDNILFVLWHGGNSHEPDIKYMEKDLVQLIKKKDVLSDKIGKDIIFGFMGYFPNALQQFMEYNFPALTQAGEYDRDIQKHLRNIKVKGHSGVTYIKGIEVDQFHDYLMFLQPDICFCPLIPNREFNNSKSPIKVIESLVAGAAVVASDIGPYSLIPNDCVIKAKTPAQICQGIQELIVNEKKRKSLVETGQRWVKDNYNLQNNISFWYEALKEVKNGKKVLDKS